MKMSKEQILRLEMFALLHDLGKLSEKFIEYRKTWRKRDRSNYNSDPHEHWLGHFRRTDEVAKPELLNNQDPLIVDLEYSALWDVFTEYYGDLSLQDVITKHTKGGTPAMNCIRWADAVEAADDRNNPLYCNEQTEAPIVYTSTVYGYEEPLGNLEAARKSLYDQLMQGNLLKNYLDTPSHDSRKQLFDAIKKAFQQGLSDTTRPDNDTTLWDHCYAVASIAKTLSHSDEDIDSFPKAKFKILGIGWNGTAFLAGAHRIADVGGRERAINEFKDNLKKEIEFERYLGNCVYEDLDGIYFIVPECFDYAELKDKIYELATDKQLYGDLWPNIELSNSATNKLSDIIKVVKKLRAKRDTPVSGDVRQLVKKLTEEIKGNELICPLCRRRKEIKELKICKECLKRRQGNAKTAIVDDKQTAYFSEIARANDGGLKRLALMIVNFDLEPWLSGQMINTMFVSDPRGMKKEIDELGENNPFEDLENVRKAELPAETIDYSLIVNDLQQLLSDEENLRAFLYGRHIRYNSSGEPYLPKDKEPGWSGYPQTVAWQVCTKTPTPSTLLDTWITAERFVKKVTGNDFLKENNIVKKTTRICFNWKSSKEITDGKVYEALVTKDGDTTKAGDRFEFVIIGKTAYVLDKIDPIGAYVKCYDDNGELIDETHIDDTFDSDGYLPIRRITATPNLGYLIIPASKVPEYVKKVQKEYKKYFGKVTGRLQMFVGAIFFDSFHPMSVIFDAAARMLKWPNKAFDGVISKNGDNYNVRFTDLPTAECIDVNIPSALGDCNEDWFHPYLILHKENKSLPTYFLTRGQDESAEPNTHLCALAEVGESPLPVYFRPNLFDYELLDCSARRQDIYYNNDGFRHVAPLNFAQRPYPLATFTGKMSDIWQKLGEEETSQIYNLETLLHSRIQDWREDDDFEEQIETFKNASTQTFAPGLENERTDHLIDAMDLFLHILQVKRQNEDENNGESE